MKKQKVQTETTEQTETTLCKSIFKDGSEKTTSEKFTNVIADLINQLERNKKYSIADCRTNEEIKPKEEGRE